MLLWVPFRYFFRFIGFFVFSKWFLVFLALYAVFSYFAVKFIMKSTLKYRTVKPEDESIHQKYKMFRRLDQQHWDERRMFVGAILFSWLKLLGVIFTVVGCYLALKIVLWGKNIEDCKDKAMRRKIEFIVGTAGLTFYLSLGIVISRRSIDYDYSSYLGPNYQTELKNEERPAAYISNHTSWIDIIVLIAEFCPGFIAKIDVKHYPFIGYIATCLGCLFVDRVDKNNRGNIFSQVVDKMTKIHNGEDTSKLLVFPEGTTTNTTCILPFKKGPFAAKLPLKPYIVLFDPINKFSLAMDVVDMLLHLFALLCKPIHHIELVNLPIFKPNEYFFRTADNQGKEHVQAYSEAMREIMCNASGLEKVEGSYDMKREYLDFLRKPKAQ